MSGGGKGRGRGRGRGRGADSRFGEWKTETDPHSDERLLNPPFYPDMLWRADGSSAPWTGEISASLIRPHRTDQIIRLMEKQREFRSRWLEIPSYVKPAEPFDVVLDSSEDATNRSSAQSLAPRAPDEILWKSLSTTNEKLKNDPNYFPTELTRAKRRRTRKTSGTWSQFEDADETESKEEDDGEDSAANPPDAGEEEEEEIPDDEEVGADYTANYYDSDVESDAGDDNEPIL